MKRNAAIFLLLVSILFGGCSESSTGGITVASLAGSWFGPGDDAVGNPGTINVTFDGSGGFSGVSSIGPAFSGTATQEASQVFSFALSDGTDGGFIADGSAGHAGFVDENFTFGVLEKGATTLPAFFNTDIIGDWSGIEVETDLVNFTTASSSVAIGSDFSFSGTTEGDPFSGTFSSFFPAYGIYIFSGFSANGAGAGQAYLSPDKTFLASWACLSGGVFPLDCSFNSWVKQ